MRLSKGFSLIDVLVGLLIASLLSVVLYRVFSQTLRIASVSSGLIDDYSDILIMNTQLERDITSVVVLKEHESQSNTQEAAAGNQQASDKAASAVELSATETKDDEKEQEERLAFSGVIKDGKLSSLSFVCTNALPDVDKFGSRLVRVRYFLAPEPSHASLSSLMREERVYSVMTKSRPGEQSAMSHPYPVMTNIESITMKFYGAVHVPAGKQQTGSSESGTIVLSSWGNEEQRKKLKRLVPEYIEISGNYRSSATHDLVPFSIFVGIPAGIAAGVEARDSERREAEKKAQQQGGV